MYPRHRDPDYAAFEDQVKLYRKFHGNWPEALAKDLVKAWNVQRDKLKSVPYPWQHAKAQLEHCNVTFWNTAGPSTSKMSGSSLDITVNLISS